MPSKTISPANTMGIGRSISDLPEEILAHIFSFYVSSERHFELMENINAVCVKWKEICKSPSLWKSVNDPKLTTDQMVELSKGGFLRGTTKLNLRYMRISPENYEQLFEIIGNCDNLQFLDMSESNFSELVIRYVAQKCRNLKWLKLDNMCIPQFDFYLENHEIEGINWVLDPFITVCGRNLVYLSLCNISLKISNCFLSRVANTCHLLEELYVSSGSNNFGITVSEFQKGCPKLRVLKLSVCRFDCSGANATNGFPHLEVFVSNVCSKLRNEELYHLLRKSNNLHTLGVNGSCVSLEVLLKIPAENIQRLYVSETYSKRCSDLKKLISRWKFTLKELDLSFLTRKQLIDRALPSLWENNFCSPLEVLTLEGSRFKALTLAILLRKCKYLRYLDVSCCFNLHIGKKKIFKTSEEVKNLRERLRIHIPLSMLCQEIIDEKRKFFEAEMQL